MSRIFWDTNLFIYLFEDYGPLSKATAELRKKMLMRGDQLLTSTLTLGEVLVKPLENGDSVLYSR
jgi:predicted nucleic acid-binding protein